MNEHLYLNLANKHKRNATFLGCFFALIAVSVLSLSFNLILKIILAVIIFAVPQVLYFAIIMAKSKNYIYEEFNPQKYYAVASVYTKNILQNDYDFNYLTGNYDTAIRLCNDAINKTKNTAVIMQNKYNMALCCFETDDLENLKKICDEMQYVFKNDKNAKAYKMQYGQIICYFSDYLNGDYEKCKQIKSLTESCADKRRLTAFYKLKIQFYYAVACYKNQEYDLAIPAFNEIAISCPKLSLGRLSQKFLASINNGDVNLIPNNEEASNQKKDMPFVALPEKEMHKGKKTLTFAILVISLAYICFNGFSSATTAEQLLAEAEGATAILEIIPLNEDGDSLCIYEKQENYGIAYLNCVKEDDYKLGTSITYGISAFSDVYCLKAKDSDLKIRYTVTTTEETEHRNRISVHEFTYGDKTAYLHILSIEEAPCFGYVISLERDG